MWKRVKKKFMTGDVSNLLGKEDNCLEHRLFQNDDFLN